MVTGVFLIISGRCCNSPCHLATPREQRQDISVHCIANYDWPDDWIFHDERFGLAASEDALLRFLAEMLHPAVRTNMAEVEQLHVFLNQTLIHDGYELVQVDAISGAPVFAGRRTGTGVPGSRGGSARARCVVRFVRSRP